MLVAPLLLAVNAPMPAFDIRLWNALPAERGNVVVSPTSVEACLGLLIPAIGPSSKAALARTLGTDDLAAHGAALQGRLRDLVAGGETTVSNAFFSTETPTATFVAAISKGYGAKAERLQPGAAGVRQVNGWVKASTKGRIPKLVDRLDNAHAVLLNAVTFDGVWATPFAVAATQKADFKAPGGTRKVDMMHSPNLRAAYVEMPGYRLAQLPYAGGRYRMTILLPEGSGDPLDLLRGGTWRGATPRSSAVDLSLPRFTLRSGPDVERALKNMGLAPLFARVDLSRALPGGTKDAIDRIVHKTYVQVDERGTKAAATTGIVMTKSAMRPLDRVVFRVDRPFAFAIQRVDSGAALFEGVVREP